MKKKLFILNFNLRKLNFLGSFVTDVTGNFVAQDGRKVNEILDYLQVNEHQILSQLTLQ